MRSHYYGTLPALAWIFGRYFYRKYRVWVAEEFFPYRLPNPKSSNPLLIYQDLYQPWKDRDEFDKLLWHSRANVHRGVVANERNETISPTDARTMKKICDRVDIVFLYPIVLRVDINDLRAKGRSLVKAGSAATASSHEYLIEDLQDHDFDVLFLDYDCDPDFRAFVYDSYYDDTTLTKLDVAGRLTARC